MTTEQEMSRAEENLLPPEAELAGQERKLSFPPLMESLFSIYYYERSLKIIRVALVLAFALYAVFGVLDLYAAPGSAHTIWIIRYAIVCPAIILVFILTFTSLFYRIMQPAVFLLTVFMGFGIVGMLILADEPRTGHLYYAGLILVIMWACILSRMKYRIATVACWLIILGYECTAICSLHMLETQDDIVLFINNNFFFISAALIGMISSYLMERSIRRDFVNKLLLEEKQKRIEFEKNELKIRDDRIRNELVMARQIQQQLIPVSYPGKNIASLYIPMEIVGGDFYDFITFREDSLTGVFISDVTGHGISSSLITAMIKSIILQSSTLKNDPAALLLHINNILVNKTGGKFVTAFYGVYDDSSGRIIYSNAGHNPPYIISHNGVKAVEMDPCVPLAVFNNARLAGFEKTYHNGEITLSKGEKLFLYTDGILDVPWPGKEQGRSQAEVEDLLGDLHDSSCDEVIRRFYSGLVELNGSDRFNDDICLICIDS